ncbi:hypothetical protein [Okeania sp. KiyG1]|uniref:hypothetical protein n=1 Tax=Okeania sp. KiyG1 TaxID=2720165 RepID=UPI00192122E9|nr:hypothetical protein [Okeania sp. KiyG1]GGA55963.1 hypothetical protein CYANOKiyG1_76700 [Okeania sp. KiyG1]
MYSYHDWSNGYQLQLLCRNKPVAKEIVSKIISIQGHTYKSKFFKNNIPEEPEINYPTIPKQITRKLGLKPRP